jgi:hypothetical protein
MKVRRRGYLHLKNLEFLEEMLLKINSGGGEGLQEGVQETQSLQGGSRNESQSLMGERRK